MSASKQTIPKEPPVAHVFLRGPNVVIGIVGQTYPIKEDLKEADYKWVTEPTDIPLPVPYWGRKVDLISLIHATCILALLNIDCVWHFKMESMLEQLRKKRVHATSKIEHKGYRILDTMRINGTTEEFVFGSKTDGNQTYFAVWERQGNRYMYGRYFSNREEAEAHFLQRVCDRLLEIDKYAKPTWDT